MISAHMPSPFVRRSPKVQRLIPNFREVEEGLFPSDKDISDHAHGGVAGGSLRKASLGSPELVQGVFRVKTNLRGSHVRVLGPQVYDGMVFDEMEKEREVLGDDPGPTV